MKRSFSAFLIQRKMTFGSSFHATKLAAQFITPFETGEEIVVVTPKGEEFRGRVATTTGVEPHFVLYLTHDVKDITSCIPLGTEDQITQIFS